MIPNYKRPRICKYLIDILERPMTDEDLDMLNYLENLEQENKKLKEEKEELKKWLEEAKTVPMAGSPIKYYYGQVLLKIKELEEGINEKVF